MKTFRLDTLFLFLATLLFLFVAGGIGLMLLQSYREYQTRLEREGALSQQVEAARLNFEKQEAYLHRLLHDEAFFERVVRQRLGYSKPNEIIFRFEDAVDSVTPRTPRESAP